jgi:hypothetical protein
MKSLSSAIVHLADYLTIQAAQRISLAVASQYSWHLGFQVRFDFQPIS